MSTDLIHPYPQISSSPIDSTPHQHASAVAAVIGSSVLGEFTSTTETSIVIVTITVGISVGIAASSTTKWQRMGYTSAQLLHEAALIIPSADRLLGRRWDPYRLARW